MGKTLQHLVAWVNSGAYLPPEEPTANRGARQMAKPVKLGKGKTFTFATPTRSGGGESKYPWDTWFNGDLLLIERSEGPENEKGTIEFATTERDFGVSVNAMIPKLHTAARRRYKVVQVSRLDEHGKKINNGLIIQARDMDTDERIAEDTMRAEEKQAKKDKAAQQKADAERAKANGTTTAPATTPALPTA